MASITRHSEDIQDRGSFQKEEGKKDSDQTSVSQKNHGTEKHQQQKQKLRGRTKRYGENKESERVPGGDSKEPKREKAAGMATRRQAT